MILAISVTRALIIGQKNLHLQVQVLLTKSINYQTDYEEERNNLSAMIALTMISLCRGKGLWVHLHAIQAD